MFEVVSDRWDFSVGEVVANDVAEFAELLVCWSLTSLRSSRD